MTQQEKYFAKEEKLSLLEFRSPKPELHHYDAARRELPPIQFAERILLDEGLLTMNCGYQFVNGKYATPSLKIEAANSVLRRMKLAPIVLGRRP